MFGEYSELILIIGTLWATILLMILTGKVNIFLHELGHFVAAKLCGLVVYKFSVFGGTPLWSCWIGETEFILAKDDSARECGYVESAIATKNWQEAVIAAAGPLSSLLFAALYLISLKIYAPLPEMFTGSMPTLCWMILTLFPAAMPLADGARHSSIETDDGHDLLTALIKMLNKKGYDKPALLTIADVLYFAIPLLPLIIFGGTLIVFYWLT